MLPDFMRTRWSAAHLVQVAYARLPNALYTRLFRALDGRLSPSTLLPEVFHSTEHSFKLERGTKSAGDASRAGFDNRSARYSVELQGFYTFREVSFVERQLQAQRSGDKPI